MEFLHPSRTDNTEEVILLVVAATKQKTKLHCYVWDSSTDLRQASQLGSGQRVPENEQLPLLLIPLTMSTAFMLVFQQFITGAFSVISLLAIVILRFIFMSNMACTLKFSTR